MQIINVHRAKTTLSKLIEKTLSGESVIIAKAGQPVVQLVPFTALKTTRQAGQLKGKIEVADDFTHESEEINNLFYLPPTDR